MRTLATVRFGWLGRLCLPAALVWLAAPMAFAQAKPEAKVVSDAGKADVDGVKGVSLFGTTPATIKAKGPGKVALLLRAKAGSSSAVKFSVTVGGKVAESGSLEAAKGSKVPGPEKTVSLTLPAGPVEIVVTGSKGNEGSVRIGELAAPAPSAAAAVPLDDDLPMPEPDLELPVESIKAIAPKPAPPAPPIPAEPAPAPAASAPAVSTSTESGSWAVRLQPFAAAGMVRETGFSSPLLPGVGAASPMMQVGANLVVTRGPFFLQAELRDAFYERGYAVRQGGADGKLPVLQLDEQNVGVGAVAGWELLHHGGVAQWRLMPFGGVAGRLLINAAVPQQVVGVQLGARLEWLASESVTLAGSASWMMNLMDYQGLPLLLGAPKSASDFRVEALVKMGGPARLKVAWQQELMVLQLAYRTYQSVVAGLDYAF